VRRSALITGITGQDGAYLARLLLERGYRVTGTYRPTSSLNLWRLTELGIAEHPELSLVEHDLTDLAGSIGLLQSARPDEVYNLAAQSFVGLSFRQPVSTAEVTALGALNLLEAVRMVAPQARFYQASSSEMFGNSQGVPQNEESPLRPRSPYAVSKVFAHLSTINYREAYGLYAVSGILFNHESPLRGEGFVTRKISLAAARIAAGQQQKLSVGNLDARRDWGYAPEFVDGIYRTLQQDVPEDFVLATGRTHTVREFASLCFAAAGISLMWEGQGVDERAYDQRSGTLRVDVDPAFYRPADIDCVIGDPGKAERTLGWRASTELSGLCALMYEADHRRLLNAPPH
jgi:GDPmannose 4,6-dehydratase